MLAQMGLTSPTDLALVVMAVGAGAMTVSHVNDSYFWVVSQFSGLSVSDAYKAQTMGTLIVGIVTIITTLIAFAILH
jgi:GntP family gluconate:H+ symporter